MRSKSEPTFPIDLVYLWVDGCNIDWQESKLYWQKKLNLADSKENSTSRYVDNQELRFSLRSVEKNAPWINKIYIVTDGSIPKWLDLTKTDKIKIVKHEEIMPEDALPTFNSCAIEACIYNIKGLSEHFLLANDDCFINKPIEPSFFFDKKGRPIFRFKKFKFREENLKNSQYIRSIKRSCEIINKKYKTNFKNIVPHHNVDAYTIEGCKNCARLYEKEFQQVVFSKFRNESIQRIIFALCMIANKKAVKKIINPANPFCPSLESDYFEISYYEYMQKRVLYRNPFLLCINEEFKTIHIYRKALKELLQALYPNQELWEKEAITDAEQAIEKYNLYKEKIIAILKKERIKNLLKTCFCVYNQKQRCKILKKINIFGIKISFTLFDEKKLVKNYSKVLNRLKSKYKKEKIKVVFHVCENSKWTYQTLFELFQKSEYFEPVILISLLTSVANGKDKTRNNTKEQYEFFKKQGMAVDYLYKNGKYKSLKKFKPDIVFYEQPWDIYKKYQPYVVSKYALTFCNSYGYEILDDAENYLDSFHGMLFTYFTEHELNLKRYESYSDRAKTNCVVVGAPKLDVYFEPSADMSCAWRDFDKIKIVYAPHHSFDNVLQFATFDKNYDFILSLAKSHPETTWIFKPHPRLKFALLKTGIMKEEDIDKYYEEWAKIGNIHTSGNYIGLFRSSDVMITDSISFLAEYIPTGKPLIRLLKDGAMPLNEIGEKISCGYYAVDNNDDLEKIFEDVVINHNDTKEQQRSELIKEIMPKNHSASQNIFNYITKTLENK